MFEDLRDTISTFFSWKWPVTKAEVTGARIELANQGQRNEYLRLAVTYKFSAGDDGPYTGEDVWSPTFTSYTVEELEELKAELNQDGRVNVRYRPSDPSVNKIDRSTWETR